MPRHRRGEELVQQFTNASRADYQSGPGVPGRSGIHTCMTNTKNTPIEALERAFPMRRRPGRCAHRSADDSVAGVLNRLVELGHDPRAARRARLPAWCRDDVLSGPTTRGSDRATNHYSTFDRMDRSVRPVVTVGVDVGGTNIQIGLVSDDHTVVGRAKRPTPREGPASVIEAVLDAIAGANRDAVDIGAVGIGIPGAVHGGEVVQVPNLAGWDGPVDIRTPIGEALGCRWYWGTMRTWACSVSGWLGRPVATTTCSVCGSVLGSVAG